MNDGMYSSGTGEWGTPREFFALLDEEFRFTLDAAASRKNAKCKTYFSKAIGFTDALAAKWGGRVWLNPPYGREIGVWVDKVIEQIPNCDVIVMLLPARTDTRWWIKAAKNSEEIRLVPGRLHFEGVPSDNGAPFPSCVMIFKPTKLYRRTEIRRKLNVTLLN